MKKKQKHNVFRTAIEIIVIILLLLIVLASSIYVNPGDSIQYQIDSPLETYVFENPYNVSQIIIASTYIVFNTTGFNVTSTNAINIRIDHIDEDIDNPSNNDDDLLVFTVTNTPGATWFNLSGFEPTLSYTVKVNDVFFSTEIANSTGDISFTDDPSLNDEYSIYPLITNFNWWLISDTEDDAEWWDEHLQYNSETDTWSGEMIDSDIEFINFTTMCGDSLADGPEDISKATFLSRINATWNTKIGYNYPFDLALSDRNVQYFPGNHDYDDSSGKRLSEAFGPATGTYNADGWINTEEEVGKEWNYTVDKGNLRFIYIGPIKDDSSSNDKRMELNGTKDWLRQQVYHAYNNSMNVIMITNRPITNGSEQQAWDTEVTQVNWVAYWNRTTGWNDMPRDEAIEDPPYNYDATGTFMDTTYNPTYSPTDDTWDELLIDRADDFWDLLNESWNSISVWVGGNLHQDPDDNGGMINQGPWSVNASYDMYGWDSYNGTGGRNIHKTPQCLFIDDLHAGAWSDPNDEYSRVIQFEEGSRDILIRTFCHELDNIEVGTYGSNTSFYSYDQDIIITDALKFAYSTTTDDNASSQSGESPTNGSTNIYLIPSLYVMCIDNDSDMMTATWRSNSSGSWVDFATNANILNNTNITQRNYDFSSASTTYYWSVNLTDGKFWINETYSFTTTSGCGGVSTIQIDNPLETYTFAESICLYTVIVEDTYIVLNTTGFNVTSSNAINIRIDHIDEDIDNPADGSDDLIVFTVTNTPGATWFNLSGFEPTLSYTVKVNNVFFSNEIADSDGVISFTDNPAANDEYSIFWTSGSNTAPVLINPYPSDGAVNISVGGSPINIYATDPDSNDMRTDIWTNFTGSWTQVAGWDVYSPLADNDSRRFLIDAGSPGFNFQDAGLYWANEGWQTDGMRTFQEGISSNGNLSVTDDWAMTSEYTKYWWSVNCTDAVTWTNHTYHFTTETTTTQTPIVQTNTPTNIQEINVTLQGTLTNDGGEDTWCRFQWGNTTNPLAHTASNQTKNSGETYSTSIRGNLTSWYDSDWLYRKQITIDHEFIDSTLTDFPIFIDDTDNDYQHARNDGYDFLFTASDGTTKLMHELEYYNGLDELMAWVNITSLNSSSDTTIWLYWGNSSATNQEDVNNTWNSDYLGVYHMNELIGTTCYDSSGYSNDGTYTSETGWNDLPNRTTGKIQYGQYLNGHVYLSLPSGCFVNNSGGAYLWTDGDDDLNTGTRYIYMQYNSSGNYTGLNLDYPTSRHFGYANDTQSWSGGTEYLNNALQMTGHVWNPNDAFRIVNESVTQSTVSASIPSGQYQTIEIGRYTPLPTLLNFIGMVDEVRVLDEHYNNDNAWTKAEYHSMNQSNGFVTYWSMETQYSDTGNMTAGTLYRYRAVANNTVGTSYGDNVSFLTRPYEPELFAALTENESAIQLTWIQIDGSGYNTTYIERSTSSIPWARGSNYNVYNGTKLIYNDTNLSMGTTYYYQAWSFTNWTDDAIVYHQYSINFDSANNRTNIPPVFTSQIPVNNSIVDIDVNISIIIEDLDGDSFNWTIETWEDIGNNSSPTDSNGTKTCMITPTHNTTYAWYVNVTDGYSWTNESYNFTAQVTYVDPPTDGVSLYDTANYRLNLSWTNVNRSDAVVVVQRNDTYATSATQSGNWIRQNSSTYFWNESWTETSGGYFTIFSYNATASMYSYNYTTPLGLDIPWGAIAVSVFNESNASQSIGFNIQITNEEGTETYTAYNQVNTLYLDLNDIPYGERTIVRIWNISYRERDSYYDFYQNNFYNLRFYLPALEIPPGGDPGGGSGDDPGGNESFSPQLYLITVVDEYDLSIEGAKVDFRRYFEDVGFENISILYTDAIGQCNLYLIPNVLYKVFISKDGYTTEVSDWIPDPIIHTHTFRLTLEPYDEGTYETVTDGISWTIQPTYRYHNGSFTRWFNITSFNCVLEWFSMNIYYYNTTNMTWILIYSENITTQSCGGSIGYTFDNITGKYRTSIWFKKQGFDRYEVMQEGSLFDFISWGGLFTNPVFAEVPDWVWLLITIIIMAIVMAFLLPYAGVATGYVGIGIFGFCLALKPDLIMPGTEGTVTGWFVLIIMSIVYTIGLFLWSRL